MSATIDINGKKLLSIKEAVSEVDYSRDYITRLAREGKIVATQIGRKWFVDIGSLKNYYEDAQLEQEIKKRQLSEERKRELTIQKLRKEKQSKIKKQRSRRVPVMSALATVLALGAGLGVVLESQTRNNFENFTQLANVKTVTLADKDTTSLSTFDLGTDSTSEVVPEFAPGVTYKDLTNDEGLLLLPVHATASVAVQEYFSDPVTVVKDQDGNTSVRRVDQEGKTVGEEIPFVLVPVNSNTP